MASPHHLRRGVYDNSVNNNQNKESVHPQEPSQPGIDTGISKNEVKWELTKNLKYDDTTSDHGSMLTLRHSPAATILTNDDLEDIEDSSSNSRGGSG